MGKSHLEQHIFMFGLQAIGCRKNVLVRCKTRVIVYEVTQRQHYLLYLMYDVSLGLQNTVLGFLLYSLFPYHFNDRDVGKRFYSSTTFILAFGPPNLLFSGYWDFFFYPVVKI
jgi:hypothetical protein